MTKQNFKFQLTKSILYFNLELSKNPCPLKNVLFNYTKDDQYLME